MRLMVGFRGMIDSTSMACRKPPSADKKRTRVLVIDDHPVICKRIVAMFDHEPDLMICGEADDEISAKKAMSNSSPDLALLGLSMRGSGDLYLLRVLHLQHPKIPRYRSLHAR